jgi:hypothetical protein
VNKYLQGYRLLTGIGILTNLTFAASAFFFPSFLIENVGDGRADLFEDPWLGNVGLLLVLTAVFYLPTAIDPRRHRLYSWISAWSRVAAAAYWVVYLLTAGGDLPGGFRTIPMSDGVLGIVLLVLLRLGLPDGAGESSARSGR